jgi:hypothetical protein
LPSRRSSGLIKTPSQSLDDPPVPKAIGEKKCSIEDFSFLKVLGKGSFGKVRIKILFFNHKLVILNVRFYKGNACST